MKKQVKWWVLGLVLLVVGVAVWPRPDVYAPRFKGLMARYGAKQVWWTQGLLSVNGDWMEVNSSFYLCEFEPAKVEALLNRDLPALRCGPEVIWGKRKEWRDTDKSRRITITEVDDLSMAYVQNVPPGTKGQTLIGVMEPRRLSFSERVDRLWAKVTRPFRPKPVFSPPVRVFKTYGPVPVKKP